MLVVTCTGGERGDVLNPALDRPEVRADLVAVRRREMAAAAVLGVRQRFLGFTDSGLPGEGEQFGARSVAFPAVSTGVYGWPLDRRRPDRDRHGSRDTDGGGAGLVRAVRGGGVRRVRACAHRAGGRREFGRWELGGLFRRSSRARSVIGGVDAVSWPGCDPLRLGVVNRLRYAPSNADGPTGRRTRRCPKGGRRAGEQYAGGPKCGGVADEYHGMPSNECQVCARGSMRYGGRCGAPPPRSNGWRRNDGDGASIMLERAAVTWGDDGSA